MRRYLILSENGSPESLDLLHFLLEHCALLYKPYLLLSPHERPHDECEDSFRDPPLLLVLS